MIKPVNWNKEKIAQFVKDYNNFKMEAELLDNLENKYIDNILQNESDSPDIFLRRELFVRNDLPIFQKTFGKSMFQYEEAYDSYILTDSTLNVIFYFSDSKKKIELIIPDDVDKKTLDKQVEQFMEAYFEQITKAHVANPKESEILKSMQEVLNAPKIKGRKM